MTSADPLAHERFRTIVSDTFQSEFDGVYGDGRMMDADVLAETLAGHFPDAHFEYRTNDVGVCLRRVVAAGKWEADPDQTPAEPFGTSAVNALGMPVVLREDFEAVQQIADQRVDRIRAAISDAIAEHGFESREHRRLRWVLSGERPVEGGHVPTVGDAVLYAGSVWTVKAAFVTRQGWTALDLVNPAHDSAALVKHFEVDIVHRKTTTSGNLPHV